MCDNPLSVLSLGQLVLYYRPGNISKIQYSTTEHNVFHRLDHLQGFGSSATC